MASGLTRNQVPGNRLRVRLPCPPLSLTRNPANTCGVIFLLDASDFNSKNRCLCSQFVAIFEVPTQNTTTGLSE